MANHDSGPGDFTLADLIQQLKLDRTYKDLENESGGAVKAQRWQQMATGDRTNEFPEPRTLEAIARTLPCRLDTLLLAVARSTGIDVAAESRFGELLSPLVDGLSERGQSALLTIARAVREAETAPAAAESTDSDDEEGERPRRTKKPRRRPRGDIPPLA